MISLELGPLRFYLGWSEWNSKHRSRVFFILQGVDESCPNTFSELGGHVRGWTFAFFFIHWWVDAVKWCEGKGRKS